MSSSKLLAVLINAALKQLPVPVPVPVLAPASAPNRTGRGAKRAPKAESTKYTVRLQESDAARLDERAAARGTAPSSYAAMVLLAHLRADPPMPHGEFQQLKRVVNELGGIRAGLAALAGTGASKSDLDGQTIAAIEKLMPRLKSIREEVQATLTANSRSWRAPDA